MANISVSFETPRGCGYRKGGGIYLIGLGEFMPCCKLPMQLTICPCCGQGIKPARGWTWINLDTKIAETNPCAGKTNSAYPKDCLLSKSAGRIGLLWIGEKFYKRPEDFMAEAKERGICRRISAVPRDFEIGKTWIALAHRKTILCLDCLGDGKKYPSIPDVVLGGGPDEVKLCEGCQGKGYFPGIFTFFCPTALEYVIKGTETEEELETLEKRGFSLVKVVRVVEDGKTPPEAQCTIDDIGVEQETEE